MDLENKEGRGGARTSGTDSGQVGTSLRETLCAATATENHVSSAYLFLAEQWTSAEHRNKRRLLETR